MKFFEEEEEKLCEKFPKLEHKYFSFLDYKDGTVTLDGDFTIDELKAIIESLERLMKEGK